MFGIKSLPLIVSHNTVVSRYYDITGIGNIYRNIRTVLS